MLDFINNNPIFASGIFGLITAIISSLITALVTIRIENKKAKQSRIAKLENDIEKKETELQTLKEQLAKYTSVEEAEKAIDKTYGAVYIERLSNNNTRCICGYCWESKHIKSPIPAHRDPALGLTGFCENCKANCNEKSVLYTFTNNSFGGDEYLPII